ncbi:MAG TPA: hypothetical protein DFR83_15930, partial [Deltaproteobacteria bacterium]|nr:hypothetical protein [Deltaproteobacteria bacterium]
MNRSKGLLPDRWFDDVDPRGDIEAIRSALATRMDAGVPSTAVVRALAERDRVVVAELLIGPRAGQGSTWTALALDLVDVLEHTLAPGPLYRRMADLAGGRALDVLTVAVQRHPDAVWLVPLSSRVEGAEMGWTHLNAVLDRASFLETCQAYAAGGARRGLLRVAVSARRVEPLVALASQADERALVLATCHLFRSESPPPVAAWLAAIWGPDPTRILVGALALLHARAPERVPILLE